MVDYVASPCLCWFTFGVHAFPAILVDSWGLRPEYRGTFAGRHVCFQEMSVAERVAERLVHGSGYGWFHWGVSHDVDTKKKWVAFLDPSLSERESTCSGKINLFHNCWLHGGILWVSHLLNRRKTQENICGLLRCVLGLPGYFWLFQPFLRSRRLQWRSRTKTGDVSISGAGMVGCFGHPTFGHRERNILWMVATSYTTMGWLKAYFLGW